MLRRFDYVQYDEQATAQQDAFKQKFLELENMTNRLEEGRAKSLIFIYLEIAYMWVGKALRDECIARDPVIQDQPARTRG